MKRFYILAFVVITALSGQAQNVLTVEDGTKTIEVVQAGQYDRVEDMWKMDKGTAYLISLPTKLDGYYFGPNAERMKVTSYEKQSDGTFVANTTAMADLDDFQAGSVYVITPDIDIDKIVHITPGIMTSVEATAEGKELLHEANVQAVTGIAALAADKKANVIYDLQGRKVSTLHKGETYIVDGKKLIIK